MANPVKMPQQIPTTTNAQGSFGYLQNPVMSGAGMPAARPMNPAGQAYKPLPMFEPKSVKVKP